MRHLARNIAAITFGVVLPVLLLYTAFSNLQEVSKKFYSVESEQALLKSYTPLKETLTTANDYILYSLMYVEQSNQKTMINKQAMKLTIIHIGFAIMCVGIMFVVLGINDGGAEAGAPLAGGLINIKTASTGFAIFLGGAVMASGGALLNNHYATAAVPGYIQVLTQTAQPTSVGEAAPSTPESMALEKQNQLIELFKRCKAYETGKFQRCLVSVVTQLYSEEMK
jgi:hypothetical protein